MLAALLGGETIVLVVRGRHPLAVRFLDVWSAANRPTSGSYHATIGRHLTISLDRSHTVRGILVVLQIGGERGGSEWRRFLDHDDAADIEALGAAAGGDPGARAIGVPSRAHEAAGTIYKDLCLLHLRDDSRNRGRAPSPILEGREDSVAWVDLREIIRTKGANAERHLDQLRRKGLLDDERWNFYRVANDFLDRQTAGGTLTGIYEAVWRYEFLQGDGYYFRGQAHSGWKLETSLFRPPADAVALDVATLVERVQRTSLFLAALRGHEHDFFSGRPSDEDLLAVAQHYGFATPLLDFSRSLRVGAFFATDGADTLSVPGDATGVIYYLKPGGRRWKQLLDRTKPIGRHGFDLFRETGLHFGQWKIIEPALAEADNRIGRQLGAFLEGANVRHVSDTMLDRIVFRQRPGDVFEDPLAGVTEAALLPDDSRLAALADDVKRRFDAGERAPIHPAMAGVVLPTPSVIGVQHAGLDAQVDEAADFFSLLGEVAEAAGANRSSQVSHPVSRSISSTSACWPTSALSRQGRPPADRDCPRSSGRWRECVRRAAPPTRTCGRRWPSSFPTGRTGPGGRLTSPASTRWTCGWCSPAPSTWSAGSTSRRCRAHGRAPSPCRRGKSST